MRQDMTLRRLKTYLLLYLKRKLGLSRIMAKLAETTGAMIGMDIFILNMEKLMRQEASLVCSFLGVVFSFALSIRKQHKNDMILGAWTAV